MPQLAELPKEREGPRNEVVRIMEDFYPNGIERMILIDKLQSELGISYGSAQVRVSRAIKTGKLVLKDKCVHLS